MEGYVGVNSSYTGQSNAELQQFFIMYVQQGGGAAFSKS